MKFINAFLNHGADFYCDFCIVNVFLQPITLNVHNEKLFTFKEIKKNCTRINKLFFVEAKKLLLIVARKKDK